MDGAQHPHISVVVPLYNEAENLDELHRQLREALAPLGRPFELVLVDDGSRDGTRDRLLALEAADPSVKAVLLRRNFGQTAAFSAGFDRSRGDVVVTSDGDLQNDPADIPALVAKLEGEDLDMVCGWRRTRQRPALEAHPVLLREPADLVVDGCRAPRLRLLAEGDAGRRGALACASTARCTASSPPSPPGRA